MASKQRLSIRDKRRQRQSKGLITSNDELYETMGGEIFKEKTPSKKVLDTKIEYVRRKRGKAIVQSDYDYMIMADRFSETNVAQQLGNYRQGMEFLAHCTLASAEHDKIIDRLKDLIYSYPNTDMSSFVNKHHAMLYSWMIQNIIRVYGQKYLGTVYVLGGGIGLLPAMLLDTPLRIENIRNIDINGTCKFLADEMMKKEVLDNWKFKASSQDLFKINYELNRLEILLPDNSISEGFNEVPGLLINTNLSHLENMETDWYKKMIPTQRKLILVGETGDVAHPYKTQKEFNAAYPMSFELYNGLLKVEDKQYFMKIGMK